MYATTMLFSVCYHVGEENNDNAEDVEGLVVGESESEEKGSKRQSRGRSKWRGGRWRDEVAIDGGFCGGWFLLG